MVQLQDTPGKYRGITTLQKKAIKVQGKQNEGRESQEKYLKSQEKNFGNFQNSF